MPELIDRQAALRLCKDADWEDDRIFIAGYNHAIRIMTQAITELPTIEPEVRRGRWIEATKHRDENGTIMTDYECSECFAMVKDSYAEEIESERFCYNCGARMDGGAGNG